MSAVISVSLGLMCFLLCSCTGQTNNRNEKIPADLGQDVILPCKVPNINNILAVEWIRPDQEPDYVLFYRDGRIDLHNQHPFYQNRVDLKDKDMKDGDVSLILKNVTMEDTGRYECQVFEEGKKEPINITILEVHVLEKITADLGENTTLPCKIPNNYNISNIIVQWNRPDLAPDYVLVYRDGRLDPVNQHPSYQNRVDLQDKAMKDRKVSLILKNVTMEDRGRYECRVFKSKNNELISITILEVHPPGDQDRNIGDTGKKTGIIVGSVVGVILLLLAVLASVGFLIYRRHIRQNQHRPVPPDEPTDIEMAIVPESPAEPPTASVPLMEPPAEEEPTEM